MTTPPVHRFTLWLGRVLSALPVLAMLPSAAMKLARAPEVVAMWSGKLGYPAGALVPIGLVELACAVLYLVPRTAVLGAVITSGYLTAAFATHLRLADPSGIGPLALAVCTWAGLYLRDPRVRALLPLREVRHA